MKIILKQKFNRFLKFSQDQTQVSITDQIGKAAITVDGCVELMTFEVNPPSGNGQGGHQCLGKSHHDWHQSAKRSNWNVRKDQKFKINLERSKDHNSRKVIFLIHTPTGLFNSYCLSFCMLYKILPPERNDKQLDSFDEFHFNPLS